MYSGSGLLLPPVEQDHNEDGSQLPLDHLPLLHHHHEPIGSSLLLVGMEEGGRLLEGRVWGEEEECRVLQWQDLRMNERE